MWERRCTQCGGIFSASMPVLTLCARCVKGGFDALEKRLSPKERRVARGAVARGATLTLDDLGNGFAKALRTSGLLINDDIASKDAEPPDVLEYGMPLVEEFKRSVEEFKRAWDRMEATPAQRRTIPAERPKPTVVTLPGRKRAISWEDE